MLAWIRQMIQPPAEYLIRPEPGLMNAGLMNDVERLEWWARQDSNL